MNSIQNLIAKALDLYMIAIIIRAIVSWFSPDPYNQIYQFLIKLTEPVLGRIRRFLPNSTIDFSPFIAILLISVLSSLIKR